MLELETTGVWALCSIQYEGILKSLKTRDGLYQIILLPDSLVRFAWVEAVAGLLAHGCFAFLPFPRSEDLSGIEELLTVYSCEGSPGIGPFWVIRTVFPFDPRLLAEPHAWAH